MDSFEIRAYGKSELAQMIFPHASETTARILLMRDLKHAKELMKKLEKKGYHKSQKFFTGSQVALISEHYCGLEPLVMKEK